MHASLRTTILLLGFASTFRDVERRRPSVAHERATVEHGSFLVAAPASIPSGGYLKYQVGPTLGREPCRTSAAKTTMTGRLSRAVVIAAQEQLNLPMGYGRFMEVRGETYLFCLEPHYHPPGGGVVPEGWHKGVTVYRITTGGAADVL